LVSTCDQLVAPEALAWLVVRIWYVTVLRYPRPSYGVLLFCSDKHPGTVTTVPINGDKYYVSFDRCWVKLCQRKRNFIAVVCVVDTEFRVIRGVLRAGLGVSEAPVNGDSRKAGPPISSVSFTGPWLTWKLALKCVHSKSSKIGIVPSYYY